jgi:Rrf2 family cysteine metabolism transcriptional repressor
MRLSCRGRYATRAMIELALHHGKGPLPLNTIAQNEGISKKYLNQLMGPLALAGLVRVVRGKKGGFVLTRTPAKITLGDILYAVEGDMSLLDCVGNQKVCYRAGECLSRPTWVELSQLINNYLRATTLSDILKKGILVQASDSDKKAIGK